MKLLMAALVLVGCGSKASSGKPCQRGAKAEYRAVDSGSQYMQRLFAHVGSTGREGRATDPAAIEAGVRGEVDMWTSDSGGPRQTDYYLMAYERPALERYLATYEAPPADREIRIEFEPAQPDAKYTEPRAHWRTYYVEKAPLLDTSAIADVEAGTNEVLHRPMVTFVLTPEGKQAFAAATTAHIGKKLAFLIDGVVVAAPIIESTITGGRLSIGADTDQAAADLAAKFRCTN